MIQTKGIRHQYSSKGQGDDGKTHRLEFPDFQLEKGEKMLLLGQSGCGKSTLLHILAGLMKPTQGTVTIGNTPLSGLSESKLDHFRGQHIGIIFQKAHFVKSLNVMENLTLTQTLAGAGVDKAAVKALLDQLHIGHKAQSMPQNLSQGEQQRVAIARALVNQPDVILADEPTSALDDANAREVIALLEEQATEHQATLIIVTHDNRLKDHFPNRIEL